MCDADRLSEGENGSESAGNPEPSLVVSGWWGYRLMETTCAGGSW